VEGAERGLAKSRTLYRLETLRIRGKIDGYRFLYVVL